MRTMQRIFISMIVLIMICSFCKKENKPVPKPPEEEEDTVTIYGLDQFCMGADLSYVNQILDHGGLYRDSGQVRDPFRIFREHGANLIRVRLWHNPAWTKTVYTPPAQEMYSDLADVEKTIKKAKDLGMTVNLDFHYSDTWADPGKQIPPAAWADITDTIVLKDSIYQYTYKTLAYLNNKGLMPEMVQIGNEINCGLFISATQGTFPSLNCCNGKWKELGAIINSGIRAVRDAAVSSSIKPKVLLHVADPKNVQWWFDNIISQAKVTDFDVVGFSYYPLWHTTVPFSDLGNQVSTFKSRYNRKVMILEVAYPWTAANADSYNNGFGSQTPLAGFPFTIDGQYNFMVAITQKVITAGGSGVIYWEPAWITSQMQDLWGTGSSFENATFFDFDGNTQKGINYMNYKYIFPTN
jgi:arabinogalactan endo-1,4-beta-galactosidase